MAGLTTSMRGIFWTIGPALLARFRPPGTTPHRPFRVELDDPLSGRIALTGALHEPPGATTLLVALHGLGGSIESSYLRRFAAVANASGLALLRVNLRGADRSGADFYHAGLTADLDAILAAPELRRFDRRVIVGFSLGGHLALRWAGERRAEARRQAAGLVAICAPLDLDLGARRLDAAAAVVYRRYVLSGLNEQLDAVERRSSASGSPRLLRVERPERLAATTIRAWDGLVVAPRWGFASAEDYYARASAAPVLPAIDLPGWIVHSDADPMVPPWTVAPGLARLPAAIAVTRTARGGHVGMPADLDLGQPGARGLYGQVVGWVARTLGG